MVDKSTSGFSILYIIGNGFDIAHSLNTKFVDFEAYLREGNHTYSNLLAIIETIINASNLWGNFEESLGKVDISAVVEYVEDLLPDPQTDRDGDKYQCGEMVRQIIDVLTRELRCAMRDWILSVRIAEKQKFRLNHTAHFLSFNYTETLEQLYGINNVCHIHNTAKSYGINREDDDSDIIVGHRFSPPKINKDFSLIQGFNQWYALDETYDEICRYWELSTKDTNQIIKENKHFFDKINSVDTVVVIGHSLSDVDLEYFRTIAKCIKKNAEWQITYFGDADKTTIQKQSRKISDNLSVSFVDTDTDLNIITLPLR